MTAAGQVVQVGVLTMATWTIELLLERGVLYAAGSILAQIVQGATAAAGRSGSASLLCFSKVAVQADIYMWRCKNSRLHTRSLVCEPVTLGCVWQRMRPVVQRCAGMCSEQSQKVITEARRQPWLGRTSGRYYRAP